MIFSHFLLKVCTIFHLVYAIHVRVNEQYSYVIFCQVKKQLPFLTEIVNDEYMIY